MPLVRSRWPRALLALTVLSGGLALLSSSAGRGATTLPPVGWSQGPALPSTYVPRWDYSYATFPPSGQIVLFGGAPVLAGQPWRNDTWIYQNNAWHQGPGAPSALKPRGGAAMAFDPDIGKIVLFGGAGPGWPPFNDTWLYDGTAWKLGPAAPAGLTARTGARMVYDPAIHKLVLFGGSGVKPYTETWLFDGAKWVAGPPAPAGMSARVFFGMVFNPVNNRILVAGGDGKADTWWFDGSVWVPGANLSADLAGRERLYLEYDPQLGGIVVFGGIGGTATQHSFYILHGTGWSEIQKDPSHPVVPEDRLDAAVSWVPGQDALLVFAGVSDDGKDTSSGFRSSWYFRDTAPQVTSVSVSPKTPTIYQTVGLTTGPIQGGYRSWVYEYAWFINGVQVPGATDKRLTPAAPGYIQLAQIQAKVRVHDDLGIYGPWVASNVATVIDQPPVIKACNINPANPHPSDDLLADARGSDPDDDPLTFHYGWTVNGTAVANNDKPTLTHDHYKGGNKVGLSCWIVDPFGGKSATMTDSVTIQSS